MHPQLHSSAEGWLIKSELNVIFQLVLTFNPLISNFKVIGKFLTHDNGI